MALRDRRKLEKHSSAFCRQLAATLQTIRNIQEFQQMEHGRCRKLKCSINDVLSANAACFDRATLLPNSYRCADDGLSRIFQTATHFVLSQPQLRPQSMLAPLHHQILRETPVYTGLQLCMLNSHSGVEFAILEALATNRLLYAPSASLTTIQPSATKTQTLEIAALNKLLPRKALCGVAAKQAVICMFDQDLRWTALDVIADHSVLFHEAKVFHGRLLRILPVIHETPRQSVVIGCFQIDNPERTLLHIDLSTIYLKESFQKRFEGQEATPVPEDTRSLQTQLLPTAQTVLEVSEKDLILRALREHGWVQKFAAEQLQISPRALNYKIKKYQITHPSWRKHCGVENDAYRRRKSVA